MSNSVWPHRWQPTRLPHPWDSPGKNTSGLPFPSPVQESEKGKWSRSVVSDSSRPHGLQPTRLLCPWDFPGKSTGVGCHCLLRTEQLTLYFFHLMLIFVPWYEICLFCTDCKIFWLHFFAVSIWYELVYCLALYCFLLAIERVVFMLFSVLWTVGLVVWHSRQVWKTLAIHFSDISSAYLCFLFLWDSIDMCVSLFYISL